MIRRTWLVGPLLGSAILLCPAGASAGQPPDCPFRFDNPVEYLTLDSTLVFQPKTLAAADFNGDGRLDIAAAGSGGAVSLVLYLQNDLGRFQPPRILLQEPGTRLFSAGDFDEDGHPDLAISTPNEGFEVLLGNGDGTFQSPVEYSAGFIPDSGVVADFDRDGHMDFALIGSGSMEVAIMLGDGSGSFRKGPVVENSINPGRYFWTIKLADFNSDGKMDLLLLDSDPRISIVFGNGDGTFGPQLDRGISGARLGTGDFNGDGHDDYVIFDGYSAWPLLSDGKGHFHPGEYLPFDGSIDTLTVGDLDGDGRVDFICRDGDNPRFLDVFRGRGDGTFEPARVYLTGLGSNDILLGDFDGDGRTDVGTADSSSWSLDILRGLPGGELDSPSVRNLDDLAGSFASGDLDRDGYVDLLVGVKSRLEVFRGGPDGLAEASTFGDGLGGGDVRLADFNGDGTLDAFFTGWADGLLYVSLNRGDGRFADPVSSPNDLRNLRIADVNGDGRADLVEFGNDPELFVRMGIGEGTFAPAVSQPVTGPIDDVLVGDFDGDGRSDAVVFSRYVGGGFGRVAVLFGRPEGGFGDELDATFTLPPSWLGVADVNGDGEDDLLISADSRSCDRMQVWFGATSRQFTVMKDCFGPNVHSAVLGDFNGDGIVDLAISEVPEIVLELGDGQGRFRYQGGYLIGGGSRRASGDFNGDGNDDLVAFGASASKSVSGLLVLMQRSALEMRPLDLVTAVVGSPYRAGLQIVGEPGATFAVTAGELPPGLLLDGATGVISGSPSNLGDYSFEVDGTVSGGCFTTRRYVLTVLAGRPDAQLVPVPSLGPGTIGPPVRNP